MCGTLTMAFSPGECNHVADERQDLSRLTIIPAAEKKSIATDVAGRQKYGFVRWQGFGKCFDFP